METTLHKWEPMELKYSKFWLLDLLVGSEIQILANPLQWEYLKEDEFVAVRLLKK